MPAAGAARRPADSVRGHLHDAKRQPGPPPPEAPARKPRAGGPGRARTRTSPGGSRARCRRRRPTAKPALGVAMRAFSRCFAVRQTPKPAGPAGRRAGFRAGAVVAGSPRRRSIRPARSGVGGSAQGPGGLGGSGGPRERAGATPRTGPSRGSRRARRTPGAAMPLIRPAASRSPGPPLAQAPVDIRPSQRRGRRHQVPRRSALLVPCRRVGPGLEQNRHDRGGFAVCRRSAKASTHPRPARPVGPGVQRRPQGPLMTPPSARARPARPSRPRRPAKPPRPQGLRLMTPPSARASTRRGPRGQVGPAQGPKSAPASSTARRPAGPGLDRRGFAVFRRRVQRRPPGATARPSRLRRPAGPPRPRGLCFVPPPRARPSRPQPRARPTQPRGLRLIPPPRAKASTRRVPRAQVGPGLEQGRHDRGGFAAAKCKGADPSAFRAPAAPTCKGRHDPGASLNAAAARVQVARGPGVQQGRDDCGGLAFCRRPTTAGALKSAPASSKATTTAGALPPPPGAKASIRPCSARSGRPEAATACPPGARGLPRTRRATCKAPPGTVWPARSFFFVHIPSWPAARRRASLFIMHAGKRARGFPAPNGVRRRETPSRMPASGAGQGAQRTPSGAIDTAPKAPAGTGGPVSGPPTRGCGRTADARPRAGTAPDDARARRT